MLVGPVFIVFAFIGALAVIVWLVQILRWIVRLPRRFELRRAARPGSAESRPALAILEERFASGEIDVSEFREMREVLLHDKAGVASARSRAPFEATAPR